MPFDMKKWLDFNVVPLIKEKPLKIHSFIWNGNPPKEVLVWLKTEAKVCSRCHLPEAVPPVRGIDCAHTGCNYQPAPAAWGQALKELVELGFRFDFTREQQLITLGTGVVKAFGGDGSPLFNPEGMASARLFKKTEEDGVGLIIQVGCQFWPLSGETPDAHMSAGTHASSAVKGFFELFDTENPLEVCAKYGAVFGSA
jgi:hypothetical protein